MPSRQHEQWKSALLDLLRRQLTLFSGASASAAQFITWTCRPHGHDHLLDLLDGAVSAVAERRLPLADGSYCIPDITVLGAGGEPTALIEVQHTHPPERSLVAARERDIPLFVVPAPADWVLEPGFAPPEASGHTDVDLALRELVDAFYRAPGSDLDRRFAYSTVEDDDGRLASARYVGSAPGPGDRPPLHGHAIQAQSCTWSCERAHEALERQWPGR